jgi:hypothetical protein
LRLALVIKVRPWLRLLVAGLSQRFLGFDRRLGGVRFVANKVALGHVFLLVLRVSMLISFHQSHILTFVCTVLSPKEETKPENFPKCYAL